VNKVRRRGNGWLARVATHGRMRSHDHGYVGSEKALGHASIRMAQSWAYGKAWR
jgi:MOSC domain-containing protein YiiM